MRRAAVLVVLLASVGGVLYLLLADSGGGRAGPREHALDEEGRPGGRAGDAGRAGGAAGAGEARAAAARLAPDDDPNRIPGPDVVVTGRVVHGERGVPGALVAIHPARPPDTGTDISWMGAAQVRPQPLPVAETAADEHGRFVLTVPRRTRLALSASSRGLGARQLLLLVPPEGNPEEVLIRLHEGFRLRGLVLDEEKEPVAGATVQAVTTGTRLPPFRFTAQTGEGGAFEIDGLDEGGYRIFVSAEGYPEMGRWIQVPATTELLIELVPGGSIRGTVTIGGSPVAGATLVLTTGDGFRRQHCIVEARTDAAGAYFVERAAPGPVTAAYLFEPSRSSARNEILLPRELVVAGEVLRYDIELERGVTVRGIVVEAGTDRGVAGAAIELFRLSERDRGMHGMDRATSGPDGRFELLHVPSGTYALEAKAPFALRQVQRWIQGEERLTMDFVVDGGAAPPEQRLEVEACGAVRGRLLDGEDLDLASFGVGIQVSARWVGGAVDDFGAFEFPQVPPGTGLVVTGWNPQAKSEPFDVVAGKVTEVDLDPRGLGGFAGFVRDAEGRGVAKAVVKAAPEQNVESEIGQWLASQRSANAGRTDDQGRFLVQVAGHQRMNFPGKWVLAAVHRDYPLVLSDPLKLPDEGEASETVLVLHEGGTVRGRVEHEGGAPAASVYVQARPTRGEKPDLRQVRNGTTDLSGRFEIPGLAAGTYAVSATGTDATSEPVEVEAGARDVRLVLRPMQAIRGVVLDDRGHPVSQARIAAIVPGDKGERSHFGTIGAGGRFQIVGLEPGSYVLEVSSQENAWQASSTFEKTRTPPVPTGSENVVVEVSSGTSLRGRVVGPGGKPVGGAGVLAVPLQIDPKERQKAWQAIRPRAITNGLGEFLLEGLGKEDVEILALAPGYAPGSATVSVTAGSVQVVLRPGEVIEGRVLLPDGTPLANHYLNLTPADAALQAKISDWQMRGGQSWNAVGGWQMVATRTDGRGDFRFTSLAAGAYGLHLQVGDAVAPPTTLQTGSGPATIRMEQGLSVRGRVVDRSGQPVAPEANGTIWVGAKAGERWLGSARPDADGYFELRGIPAGPCLIQAWAGGRYKSASAQTVAGDREVLLVLEDR